MAGIVSSGPRRGRHIGLLLAAALAVLALTAPVAQATFHHIMIREVYPGPSDTGYVELQAYDPGEDQHYTSGHKLDVFDASGSETQIPMCNDISGTNQKTVLIGDTAASGTPDCVEPTLNLSPAGGAVCWEDGAPPDCVAWGSFTAFGSLFLFPGPAVSPSGVTATKAIRRSIADGCATQLEPIDDNDVASDWSEVTPNPRNNSTTPTETACGTLPITSLLSHPTVNGGGFTTSTSASFTYSADGGATGFKCKLDSGPYTACNTQPQTYSSLSEGAHAFVVRGINGTNGSDATGASFSWTIDHTAPDTTIDTHPADNSPGASAGFTFHSSESGSTFECKLDAGSFGSCTSPKTYSLGTTPDNGSHTVQVRATDQAGNVDATPASFTWNVDNTAPDTTPPQTTLDTHPTDPTGSTIADFTYHADEPSTFECKLDSGAFTSCLGTGVEYTGLSVGPHTFQVRATDTSSNHNVDATPAGFSWSVTDTTPPDTVIDTQPSNPSSSAAAAFTYHSTEGSSTFECKLDSGSFASCAGTGVSYSSLANGSHTFQVRATDAATNVDASPATYTWIVNVPPPPPPVPNTTITSGPPASTKDRTPTFKFKSSVAGSTFQCKVDGKAYASCRSPFTTKSLSFAKHTVLIRAVSPGGTDPSPAKKIFKVIKPKRH